jgi:hypothetical protein
MIFFGKKNSPNSENSPQKKKLLLSQPAGTRCLNMGISELIFHKHMVTLVHFFPHKYFEFVPSGTGTKKQFASPWSENSTIFLFFKHSKLEVGIRETFMLCVNQGSNF